MEKMSSSQPVFIRCIKPNGKKSPKVFEDDYVEAQVRCKLSSSHTQVLLVPFPLLLIGCMGQTIIINAVSLKFAWLHSLLR